MGPRPPRSHVLLGVEPDVNDPAIIEAAVQRRMDQLDKYALSSDRATREQVQKLMNEVAKARVTLVERAEAQVKKANAKAAEASEPMPAEPSPIVALKTETPTPPPPTPAVATDQPTEPRKPLFNFELKFAWPRLSAETWSLMGVVWLMSLAATAVGAYFIASNQTVPEPVEIAGNSPIVAQDNAEPNDEPGPGTPDEENPETNPAPENKPEPELKPDTKPTPPQTPEAVAAESMNTIMQITDRQARLKAYLAVRDDLAFFSKEQQALIAEATRRFNGSDDLEVKFLWRGGRYGINVGFAHGVKQHPNLKLTDLSAFTGLDTDYLNLTNCRAVRDLSVLGTMNVAVLMMAGSVGVDDLTQLNQFQSIKTLYLGGSAVTSLEGLSIKGLKKLSIMDAPITDLSPLSKMELEELFLVNCYRLTSLTAMESMPPLQMFRLIDEPDRRLSDEFTRVESIRPSVTARYTAELSKSVWSRVETPTPRDPVVVQAHIAEHNELDRITDVFYRHRAFIKLRDRQAPFSEAQSDLIKLELMHLNKTKDVPFTMHGYPDEPKIMVGIVGKSNRAITQLSPLEGIQTHTLSLQHLTDLRDFEFLKGKAVHTLELTGCSQFEDVSILREVNGLASLDIGQTAVSDLRELRLKSLKTLTLDGCKGLPHLDGLQGMELEVLSAAGCTSIREVSALARVRGLKHVSLADTAIQSASALTRQKDLAFLSLNDCEKLITLSGLHLLSELKHLHLHNTPMLDHVDIERLKARMPDTKFSYADDDVVKPDENGRDAKEAERDDKVAEAQTVRSIRELTKIKSGEERLKAYYKLRDSLEPFSDEQKGLVQWAFLQSNTPDKMEECLSAYGDSYNLYFRTYRDNGKPHSVDYITDLSAFSGLKFTTLDLDRATNLRDFTPIASMSVMRLDLSRTRMSDLKQIKGVKDLVQLDLSSTGVRDLSPIEAEELDQLELNDCIRLTSLDGLEGKTIDTLSASGSINLSDFSALKEIKDLESLVLNSTRIGSLKQLDGLDSLEYLSLSNCKNLSSLKTLTTLKSLKTLYLYSTNIPERDLRALQAAMPNTRVAY